MKTSEAIDELTRLNSIFEEIDSHGFSDWSRRRQALQHAVEVMKASQWQTMDTAPKTGEWVLLTGGDIDCGWDSEEKPAAVVAQYNIDGAYSDGMWVGNWQFAWYDSGYYGEYKNPTHWMRPPARPEENAQ